jgi:hypothetical protein
MPVAALLLLLLLRQPPPPPPLLLFQVLLPVLAPSTSRQRIVGGQRRQLHVSRPCGASATFCRRSSQTVVVVSRGVQWSRWVIANQWFELFAGCTVAVISAFAAAQLPAATRLCLLIGVQIPTRCRRFGRECAVAPLSLHSARCVSCAPLLGGKIMPCCWLSPKDRQARAFQDHALADATLAAIATLGRQLLVMRHEVRESVRAGKAAGRVSPDTVAEASSVLSPDLCVWLYG